MAEKIIKGGKEEEGRGEEEEGGGGGEVRTKVCSGELHSFRSL